MTPIPASYDKHGYTFTLFRREGNVAIYEQRKGEKLYAFEVVKIRQRPAREIFGKQMPAAERLPSDEEWGQYGKTFSLFGGSRVLAERCALVQMATWTLAEQRNRSLANGACKTRAA